MNCLTLVARRETCWRCHRIHRHDDLVRCAAEYLHGALRHLVDERYNIVGIDLQERAVLLWDTTGDRDAADLIDDSINILQRALEVRDDACQRKVLLAKVP